MVELTVKTLAQKMDYAFLKLDGDPAGLEIVCREAIDWGMWMVAIHPADIERCLKLLQGSPVRAGATIGFPLGQNTPRVKAFETEDALGRGAHELDMVINVRALQRGSRSGDLKIVREEINSFAHQCRQAGATSKVILETCYLNEREKRLGCQLCLDAGVDFVKTSSGFTHQGATLEDVRLIRQIAEGRVQIKAAGGISTLAEAQAFLTAGASRLGTSRGAKILEELRQELLKH